MLFKAGQISLTLREWDDSTYDVTNNLVAENGRKSQKYAKNVIFLPIFSAENVIFSHLPAETLPEGTVKLNILLKKPGGLSGSGVPTFIVILRPYLSLNSFAIRQNCRP